MNPITVLTFPAPVSPVSLPIPSHSVLASKFTSYSLLQLNLKEWQIELSENQSIKVNL